MPSPQSPAGKIICDTETGGLTAGVHPLLEIGAVCVSPEGIDLIPPFSSRILPPLSAPIEDEAIKVNGYDRATWLATEDRTEEAYHTASYVLLQFHEWLASAALTLGHGERPKIVAQSATFEAQFLSAAFAAAFKGRLTIHPKYHCTKQTAILHQKLGLDIGKSAHLEDLLQHYGIATAEEVKNNAHGALWDARKTAALHHRQEAINASLAPLIRS